MKKPLFCFFCFLLLCINANAQLKNFEDAPTLDSGKIFHFADMTDINGKKIKANRLSGKIVVINFWFLGCPPCRYELPQLSKIAEDYKNNKDIVFIAISTDSIGALKEFLKSNTFNYQLVGDGARIFASYGVKTYPLNLIINKEGTIIFNSYGCMVASVPARIRDILKK